MKKACKYQYSTEASTKWKYNGVIQTNTYDTQNLIDNFITTCYLSANKMLMFCIFNLTYFHFNVQYCTSVNPSDNQINLKNPNKCIIIYKSVKKYDNTLSKIGGVFDLLKTIFPRNLRHDVE